MSRGSPPAAPPVRSKANVARGRWAEAHAARWYEQHGYTVLDRNWRAPDGEIDLVVGKPGLVVICEVKARATDRYGFPGEAVGWTKQRRLRRLAAAWLAAHDAHGVQVRFDVVSVLGTTIDVIEGAF